MRVLIVKLSSMGDIIQALPAITDACAEIDELHIDWAIDESFADIPLWHDGVQRTIVSAHRRWRSRPLTGTLTELSQYWSSLRKHRYDVVIDAQSNLKSALVTRIARGNKHGLDKHSARELGASWAYDHHYSNDKNQLAIERWRQLFADVFDYARPASPPDFGLARLQLPFDDALKPSSDYLVFVHNASWPSKLWPDDYWHTLIDKAASEDKLVLLPSGTPEEKCKAENFAQSHTNARALPRMSLSQLAPIIKMSEGAICMDTGLAHLAAALGIRTVTMYGPTDARLIGATGPKSEHLIVSNAMECVPCYKKVCTYNGEPNSRAVCLQRITPEHVWDTLKSRLGPRP